MDPAAGPGDDDRRRCGMINWEAERRRPAVPPRRSRMNPPALLGLILTAALADAPASADVDEFFESRIRPVLVEHCQGCHGPKKQQSGLRLDSAAALRKGADSGPVVVAGDAEG